MCYRASNSNIFGTDNHDTIRALLNEMGTGKHHFVLMGDFNYSIINWPPLHEDSCNLDTRQFYQKYMHNAHPACVKANRLLPKQSGNPEGVLNSNWLGISGMIKSFFAYERSKTRCRVKVGPVLDDNDRMVTDSSKGVRQSSTSTSLSQG